MGIAETLMKGLNTYIAARDRYFKEYYELRGKLGCCAAILRGEGVMYRIHLSEFSGVFNSLTPGKPMLIVENFVEGPKTNYTWDASNMASSQSNATYNWTWIDAPKNQ